MTNHLVAAALALWLLLPRATLASFSVVLASGEEECFAVLAPYNQSSIIYGDFDLLDDDLSSTPISARLESDEAILWSSHSTETEGIFEVTTHVGGKHRLCLENGKHFKDDGLQRHIGWAIRVRKQQALRSLREDVVGPDQERALDLVYLAESLEEEWDSLLDHYGYLRDRETTHTVMSASIMTRVVRWTILEGLSLFFIAFCQVMYLRKFFEKRRYL